MKLGIFGDSFADDTTVYNKQKKHNKTWMKFLSESMECDYFCWGTSGTSVWRAYDLFTQTYGQYSHIVFTYSSLNRIHHLPDHLQFLSYVKSFENAYDTIAGISESEKKPFLDAVENYFEYFHSEKLDLFVYQSVFDKVNSVCDHEGIKLLNNFPFEMLYGEDRIIDTFSSIGSCFFGGLEISNSELTTMEDKNFPNKFMSLGDNRPCHMSQENNKILAELFRHHFENDFNMDIKLQDCDFTFDWRITDRYHRMQMGIS